MTEPQGQHSADVIETPQGQHSADVIEGEPGKKPETTPTIPNGEWQQMQETLRFQQQQLEKMHLDRFESDNPIVKSEKYKEKWDQTLKQKNDPKHPYHRLSHDELRKLVVEPEYVTPKPAPQSVSMPSLNPSAGPDPTPGKMDAEARKWLEMRYTKEQIDAMETAA